MLLVFGAHKFTGAEVETHTSGRYMYNYVYIYVYIYIYMYIYVYIYIYLFIYIYSFINLFVLSICIESCKTNNISATKICFAFLFFFGGIGHAKPWDVTGIYISFGCVWNWGASHPSLSQ